jgi:hypothetical protein
MDIKYLSFGSSCAVTYNLSQCNKRNECFPFDWLYSSICSIIDAIYFDFQYFTDITKIKNISYNFPLLHNDWNEEDNKNGTTRCINKYNFIFVHDYDNTMSNIDAVKCKYERRIERFRVVMRDKNIHKKIYCVGTTTDEKNIDRLIQVMNDALYVNFTIRFMHYSDMGTNECWKMTNFNWSNWFDT